MTNQLFDPTSASDIPTPHEVSLVRSRRWLWMGVVLAIVAVFALVAVRWRTATQTSARAKVAAEAKPVSSAIALGSIFPGNSVIHLNEPASSGEAMLQSLFVRQNEHVTRNQIVGALDSVGRLKAAVSVARAPVAQEQAAFDIRCNGSATGPMVAAAFTRVLGRKVIAKPAFSGFVVAILPLVAWLFPRIRDQVAVLTWIRKGGYVSHEGQKQKLLFGELPTIEDSVARYSRDRGLIASTTNILVDGHPS